MLPLLVTILCQRWKSVHIEQERKRFKEPPDWDTHFWQAFETHYRWAYWFRDCPKTHHNPSVYDRLMMVVFLYSA